MRYALCGALGVLSLLLPLLELRAGEKKEVSFLAEQTEVFFEKGLLIKKYSGNVAAASDGMTLTADRATYYEPVERMELVGGVCIRDTSTIINADSITYWFKEDRAAAAGQVLISQDGQRLSSNQAVYFRNENRITAQGDVQLAEEQEKITVTGGRAEYNMDTAVAVITDRPVLIKSETQEDENLILRARRLELHRKEKKVIAVQDVHLNKKRISAACGQMTYLQTEERLFLENEPEVVQKRARGTEEILNGNTIEIVLKDGTVSEVTVTGEATGKTIQKSGEEVSQVSGQKITLKVENEELQSIAVADNAASIYYFFKPEDSQREINEVSGDTVQFFFREGELHRVIVTGGAMGTYSSSGKP